MSNTGEPKAIVDGLSCVIGALGEDHDMHEVIKAYVELAPKAIEKIDVEEARRQPTVADAVRKLVAEKSHLSSLDTLTHGVARARRTLEFINDSLNVLVYTPTGAANAPVIIYFHGGGWVISNAEVYDGSARGLAARTGAIVVSVEYRKAPEHPFPAAWDDAVSAYQWMVQNASLLGGDSTRIALAGESAGGSLALATAVAARERGLQKPMHVLTVYPVAQTETLHTESYLQNSIAKPLNKPMIEWFFGHLLNDDKEKFDPRLNVIEANLSRLPSITIINAAIDPLRDDGAMLQEALRDAGVEVQRKVYSGVTHEFFGCTAVVEKARQAQAFAANRLKAAFG